MDIADLPLGSPLRFQDVQIRGPYLQWVHTHDFTEEINSTRITDRVAYRLPCGWIGELFHPFIRRKLERIFDYRKKAVHEILGSLHRTGHS